VIERIPGFKGSRGKVKILNNISLSPRTLEPLAPLIMSMNKKGFTLIEIIILIVMAGILLPVIIVPFVTGIKESGKPEMAAKAIYLAHQRMEEFTKFQYMDATLNPIGLTLYAAIPGNSGYEWQLEIVLVDNNFVASGSDVGYKRIFVRVKDPQSDTYEIYSVVTRFP